MLFSLCVLNLFRSLAFGPESRHLPHAVKRDGRWSCAVSSPTMFHHFVSVQTATYLPEQRISGACRDLFSRQGLRVKELLCWECLRQLLHKQFSRMLQGLG
ncbi:unnamed protein product [Effrenium voratum]|nr:unnamed protein product [Effrenium voratum]